MGALFLDGGIDLADRVFGEVLFDDDERLMNTWINLSRHPLQEDEPSGDRHWIASSPVLQVCALCNSSFFLTCLLCDHLTLRTFYALACRTVSLLANKIDLTLMNDTYCRNLCNLKMRQEYRLITSGYLLEPLQ